MLILLCVLAAFVPALTMDGIPGALFKPLALAIGFSMTTSFILSQTFVLVMANWLIKEEDLPKRHGNVDVFDRFKAKVLGTLNRLFPSRKAITLTYLVVTLLAVRCLFALVGTDVFPSVNSSQFQVRIKVPEGTRIESTEKKVHQVLGEIEEMVGKEHIKITSAFIGQHPSTFAVSPIYLCNAGPHVEVDIKNRDKVLLLRMIVDATISLKGKESTFFVPKSALVDSNVGVDVMQVVDGKTKKTVARKGRNNGMMIEVFGNLNEGDILLKMINEETKEDILIT